MSPPYYPWHLRFYVRLILVTAVLSLVAQVAVWISRGEARASRMVTTGVALWTAWNLQRGERSELLWLAALHVLPACLIAYGYVTQAQVPGWAPWLVAYASLMAYYLAWCWRRFPAWQAEAATAYDPNSRSLTCGERQTTRDG